MDLGHGFDFIIFILEKIKLGAREERYVQSSIGSLVS